MYPKLLNYSNIEEQTGPLYSVGIACGLRSVSHQMCFYSDEHVGRRNVC